MALHVAERGHRMKSENIISVYGMGVVVLTSDTVSGSLYLDLASCRVWQMESLIRHQWGQTLVTL